MTIKVSKPSINLREKLTELDFDKVPFQKMPAGSVLQVKYAKNITSGSVVSTTTDIVTVSINKTTDNSYFMIAGGTYLSPVSLASNQDTADPSLMFRVGGTVIDTGLAGYNKKGFYGVDVPMYVPSGGEYPNQYDMHPHNSMQEYIGGESAGTTLTFSLALYAGSLGVNYNRVYQSTTSNGMTYIQVMEIAQ